MTKKIQKGDTGKPKSRQLTLFDEIAVISAQVEKMKSQPQTGSGNIQTELKEAIAKAMAESGRSRFEIAGQMSDLLAQDVSKYQLDAYVAESKEGHRMPAEYLPAFCIVTTWDPLELICKRLGLFLMPGHDALRSEIQLYDERIRELQREKNKRKLFLEEMETKKG